MTEASCLITKYGRGKGTDSLYLEHEHFLFTAQCPSYSWYHRIKSFLSVSLEKGCFTHVSVFPGFMYFAFHCFETVSMSMPVYLGFFCLFVFLMGVSCQQLLKYLRGGLPAEVHNVTFLGKFSASTNPTEKGYAFLK